MSLNSLKLKRGRWDKRSVRSLYVPSPSETMAPREGTVDNGWNEPSRLRRPNEHLHKAKKRKKTK